MCGFLGEISFSNKVTALETFKSLLALSYRRGPDSTKITTERNFQLGFNRLALLDLSPAGDQPKVSHSKRYHLVFNGEIYNYQELRVKHNLENLKSTSDTEVILALLDVIGIDKTLKELNGMYGIAIVDTVENYLYLARDFAGIKPLFYAKNKKGIVFASQYNQLFKHPWFKDSLALRPDIVKEYFAFGYMQAPNTIFKKMFQVNPGEYLRFNFKGDVETFEILKFEKSSGNYNDKGYNLKSLKKKLLHAIKLQSHSDRSLASFLSGGIDSSLIVSYAKKVKSDIEAFTLKVNDNKLNESDFAITYGKHLKVKHRIVEAEPEAILNIVDEHFEAFSEPFGDYSSIPTYMVTKEAKVYHTAMLSGDGGDELFWGYPRMYDFLLKHIWFKMPLFFRKNLVRITNNLGLTDTRAPFYKDLRTFWMYKHIMLPERLMNKAFKNGFSKEMLNMYKVNSNENTKELQYFLRWNEFYAHMQRILIKVDRTSMHNSLELRVPLLDKNIIQEAWSSYFKINKLKNLKRPLKQIVEEEIPVDLLMQKKKGFSVPIEDWFRNELKEDLIEKTLKKELYGNDYFNQQMIKDYVNDFLDGSHNNGWGIWHIYAWQNWAIKSDLI
ncbi:MAG: asparagine synthase (glutamine-hydrolyzing) [Winogradskyella sp.]